MSFKQISDNQVLWVVRRTIVVVALLYLIAGCTLFSTPPQPLSAAVLYDLFVREPSATPVIQFQPISSRMIDSLVGDLRKASYPLDSTRALTAILNDSAQTAYAIGYHLPIAYRLDTLYPLIVYLHGGIGTTLSTKGEKAYEMVLPLGDSIPLFLASPSGNRLAPWWSPLGLQRIMQTVRFMSIRYPIDPDRIFLCGVSDGATGCYMAANTIGQSFAGFFAISGFGGMLTQMGIPLVAANIMQRPIYNVNAGQDRLYPIASVNHFLDGLAEQGVYIERSIYPDQQHGFEYRFQEYGRLCQYIRSWRRPDYASTGAWAVLPGFPAAAQGLVDWHIVEKPAKLPLISWRLQSDTVTIKSQSLTSVTLRLDAKSPINVYRLDKKMSLRCSPEKSSMGTVIRAMRQSGYPRIDSLSSFTIKL